MARSEAISTQKSSLQRRDFKPARPRVAVDTVLFAVDKGRLKSFLVPMYARGRATETWAFPGGLVQTGEMLDDAARREIESATGLRDFYLEQLFTFGDPSRDPRSHVVSVAYMALVPGAYDPAPHPDYPRGRWFEFTSLPPLAYDHREMAAYALLRLKAKLEYTNIAYAMLPREFTFAELEDLYALILDRPIDRRNFRRRIMSMGILQELARKRGGAHRPAALYSFVHQSLHSIEML